MFLVGSGILVHSVDFLHHEVEDLAHLAHLAGVFKSLTTMLLNAVVGLIIGVLVVAIVTIIDKMRGNKASSAH